MNDGDSVRNSSQSFLHFFEAFGKLAAGESEKLLPEARERPRGRDDSISDLVQPAGGDAAFEDARQPSRRSRPVRQEARAEILRRASPFPVRSRSPEAKHPREAIRVPNPGENLVGFLPAVLCCDRFVEEIARLPPQQSLRLGKCHHVEGDEEARGRIRGQRDTPAGCARSARP